MGLFDHQSVPHSMQQRLDFAIALQTDLALRA